MQQTNVAPKRMQLYKNMLFTNMDQSWFCFLNFHKSYLLSKLFNFEILCSFVNTFKGNGNPQHSCQIPMDLNLYPPLGKKELMGVDVKLQLTVGYWASRNGLHDDKIYRTIIKMFIPKSMSNLPQP